MVIDSKLEHELNKPLAIEEIPSGILTELNFEQPLNTPESIEVTFFGIMIDVNPVFWNAYLSIDLTLSGMIIDFKLEHELNKFFLIEEIPSGILTELNFEQSLNTS